MYERLARQRANNPSDAADIFQTFALKALERAGQLRDTSAVRGWLRRIFENSVTDHFRMKTKNRRRELPLEEANSTMEYAIAQPSFVDETQLIRSTMGHLKGEYVEIICRVDLQDQPIEQIADDLGITANNLAVRLHRARAAFRAALDRQWFSGTTTRPKSHCNAHGNCHQAFCPLGLSRKYSSSKTEPVITVQSRLLS